MKKIILLFLIIAFYFNLFEVDSKAYYNPNIDIYAESVLLANLDNEQVILNKNADAKMYPASLTKIMTSIVVLENVQDIDNTNFTATQGLFDEFIGIDISTADIRIGETLSVRQLLYAIMLQSANEAANILAFNVGNKSIPRFVNMMNETADKIGATNTKFINPHGLFNKEQYTTASDLLKITKYALNIPVFKEICFSSRYDVPATNKHEPRVLATTVLMQDRARGGQYYRNYIKGVKTGTIPESGRCVITTAEINGSNYLCVVLKSPIKNENGVTYPENMSFIDTLNIYDWVQKSLKVSKIAQTDQAISETDVSLSADKGHILLYPDSNFSLVIPKDADNSVIQKKVTLKENVRAPIKSGDILGYCELILFDQTVKKVNLIASEDVQVNYLLFGLDFLFNIFNSLWMKIALVFLLIAILLYVFVVFKSNKNKKYKIKRSKRRR